MVSKENLGEFIRSQIAGGQEKMLPKGCPINWCRPVGGRWPYWIQVEAGGPVGAGARKCFWRSGRCLDLGFEDALPAIGCSATPCRSLATLPFCPAPLSHPPLPRFSFCPRAVSAYVLCNLYPSDLVVVFMLWL